MKILNTPIHELTFNDVVAFCAQKHVEGIQIDYKQGIPPKGLAKQFAAFSNTRGGIIIVGVEEDSKTGVPLKWEGIQNQGKLIDRVHQFAANVEPIPDYDVCVTNESNGKVFLLIRIFEGDSTPYYVQNDFNIYVRTGNITNLIDIASPEALSLLFGKREQASRARNVFIDRADDVYDAALSRAERERLTFIASEKERKKQEAQTSGVVSNTNFKSRYYQAELGTQASMCTVVLQPYYPHKAFIQPLQLKHSIEEIRVHNRLGDSFPSLKQETIPDGVLSFSWGEENGLIECEQIYGYGLVFNAQDVVWHGEDGKKMWLSQLARHLLMTLQAAGKYYKTIGYQGIVVGYMKIDNVEDVVVRRIIPRGLSPGLDTRKKCLLDTYKWELDTDTTVLNDAQTLRKFFKGVIDDVYVGFDYMPPEEAVLDAFLQEEQLLQ